MILSNENIYGALVEAARQWPEQLAIADEYGILTYNELFQQTEHLKARLVSLGVGRHSGLALITRNNRQFIIGLYAALACDCIVMPLAHYQKTDESKNALKEARVHFILAQTDPYELSSQRIKTKVIHAPGYDLYFNETGFSVEEKTISFVDNPAVMRFTSGTTGKAKCVVLSHQSVWQRIEAANEGLQLTENDRVVWVLPMAYHFIVSIMLYIRYGCGIIICNDFLAENILDKAIEHQGTFLYASPMHIRLLASCKKEYSLPALRRVISTTTSINAVICRAFEVRYNIPVSQAFGIIEVGLPIINTRHSNDHPEAVGYALPAYVVGILDEEQRPLPANEIGHLAIKGPGIFDGYLSPPTRRDEVLKNGWFLTGDLAAISNDGLIEIKGRTKNIINVSGNKVFPNEVEEVINGFPGVVNSKVYSQKHVLMGEIVAADIMLSEPANIDTEALILHCRQSLSSFKIPQRITVVDFIEMTGSGKIKRT